MKKNAYICNAQQVERTLPIHITSAIKRCSLFSKVFSSLLCKTERGNASFCIHTTEFYNKMHNRVKFGWSANNSNRVRFYGKTVIDGKTITSKKYRDALSAMEWGKNQLNRECTGIYCITVSGAHVPMNVQFI